MSQHRFLLQEWCVLLAMVAAVFLPRSHCHGVMPPSYLFDCLSVPLTFLPFISLSFPVHLFSLPLLCLSAPFSFPSFSPSFLWFRCAFLLFYFLLCLSASSPFPASSLPPPSFPFPFLSPSFPPTSTFLSSLPPRSGLAGCD